MDRPPPTYIYDADDDGRSTLAVTIAAGAALAVVCFIAGIILWVMA